MKEHNGLKTLGGLTLGVVGVAICAGLLFATSLEEGRRSLIVSGSHCPVENSVKVWGFYEIFPPKIPRKIAVVIDATDRIPMKQRGEIADWFKLDFVRSLDMNKFANVAIFQLDEIISDKAPEFEKCAPPSEAHKWVEDPKIVRDFFEKEFHNQLLVVVESLASKNERNFSPILEMMEKMFDSYDEIILVSDLMHHTPGYSLYKNSNQDYKKFSRSAYAATISKNRQNKKLTTIYVIRNKLKQWQNKTLRGFWQKHLEIDEGEFFLAKKLSEIVE